MYTVRGDTSGERAMTVELRVQTEAAGGLPEMETAQAVVQALAAAMSAAGATQVTATSQVVDTANISIN